VTQTTNSEVTPRRHEYTTAY